MRSPDPAAAHAAPTPAWRPTQLLAGGWATRSVARAVLALLLLAACKLALLAALLAAPAVALLAPSTAWAQTSDTSTSSGSSTNTSSGGSTTTTAPTSPGPAPLPTSAAGPVTQIPAQAALTAPADAIVNLLRERGLLTAVDQAASAAEASPFVQHLRDRASDMVLSAMHFLGVPYRRGGNSAEEGFDCSGFTRHVFERSLGLVLPRRADQQAQSRALRQVARHELKPGDLVFFNTMRRAFSHVGIYVGDGKFIHAPRSGAEVRIEDMRVAYWSKRFNGARRADAPHGAALFGPAEPQAAQP